MSIWIGKRTNEMNVVITPGEYKSFQVYFTEKRANTHIANSTFNRITYSTPDFVMNGIYIQFELFVRQTEQNFNSNIYNCYFDTQQEHNRQMLSIFQNIETSILDKWSRTQYSLADAVTPPTSQLPTGDIIQQLRTGVISVWKHDMVIHDKPQYQHFIIKISGVWENETGRGLTYKFF
jgi:hypothetical protein